ncbi:ArnT family glycosyltransferase [Spirosoma utsteinense]|uniref:4-amino-4-deoxy-L-arabinose transferase-like glycosyltransferase n=1 Tax=Spirosoma utsteinense TaxID=2585773 RepID=A0ABR6W6Y4_9BACT|nr:glycosyltransferase family 39 protein [Spirosoma utsteinense]MBC3786161.1 4-amino-4-deoxy-L-arabinose transferase-like glycosyltransferase [Spirosoma utsteinense]MBC3792351.1 4-amino-4-deoxy-L-arabinose transferase-like glycosyltransferase [Spirosoma utsteinense]
MPAPQQRTLSPSIPDSWFYALVAAGLVLNATGLFPPIQEPDGALYANIAKVMAQSGDFVNLYAVGTDWLDKPHFPFWVTAVSFRIFGVNTVGYKLPALLFFAASVGYTYRFTRSVYPKIVAQVATLVLLTAFHGVLSNFDVRAEPYLMGLIMGAVYHFWRVYAGDSGEGRAPVLTAPVHLLLGSLLTGCALMTKGVFVLVPIGAGLVFHWLVTGQWRELLKLRWYVAVALSFLFTAPEIYCLYQQFDLHPEKVIFGDTGVSGVRFFFWDSQFGRFFNTGPIKGAGDKFFFFHTLLWAFLPWSLPFYAGVGRSIAGLVKRQHPAPEYVSLGAGLATFALFSLSAFQLPHYMNIVFPFFAILTARFLVSLSPVALRWWTLGQTVLGVVLMALSIGLLYIVQPDQSALAMGWVGAVTLLIFLLFRGSTLLTLAGRMVGTMLVLAGVLNLFIYPTLMPYQAGMTAAHYANEQPGSAQRPTLLYMPGVGVGGGSYWTYEFYANHPTRYVRSDSALRHQLQRGPQPVFTSAEEADSLAARHFSVRTVAVFPYYHVSKLSYDFLNRDSRARTLSPYVLVSIGDEGN